MWFLGLAFGAMLGVYVYGATVILTLLGVYRSYQQRLIFNTLERGVLVPALMLGVLKAWLAWRHGDAWWIIAAYPPFFALVFQGTLLVWRFLPRTAIATGLSLGLLTSIPLAFVLELPSLPNGFFAGAWWSVLPRLNGLAFNENAFGAWFATLGLLALLLIKRWRFRAPVLIVTASGLLLSGSRNAILAFALGGIVYVIGRHRFRWLIWLLPLAVLAVPVVMVFAAIWGAQLNNPLSSWRVLEFVDRASSQIRLEIFAAAGRAWLESPLLGVTDYAAGLAAQLTGRVEVFGLSPTTVLHAHNLWLQTLLEGGVLGLVALMWLWSVAIGLAWQRRSVVALALLTTVLLLNSLDYLYYFTPVQIAFWFALSDGVSDSTAPQRVASS